MEALDFENFKEVLDLENFSVVKLRKFHVRSGLVNFTIEFGLRQLECSNLENFS